MNILNIKEISFAYEDGTKALKDVNLTIEKGEKVAFVGANGSGKSTLFLCLNGILKPQSGEILYQNKPITYSRKGLLELRSKVGIVFQEPDNQLFASSVYQEISFGILNLGVLEQEAQKKVELIMEELEITPFRHRPTHLLSGGQKKQVSLADVLVMEPKILIMDEPVSALDPKHTKMLHDKLKGLPEQGITVIISTHDLDFALEWADKIVVFNEGRVIAQGIPCEIFMNKERLIEANLLQPSVLQLYSSLCEKGIIRNNLPVPKDFITLEKYITDCNKNKV